jgi:hypothetical protein
MAHALFPGAPLLEGSPVRVDADLRIPATDGFRLAATLHEPATGRENGTAVLLNSARRSGGGTTTPSPASWRSAASRS